MGLTYISFLEPVSGVYTGQVIDVCSYIAEAFDVPTQLIAIFSPRSFAVQRDALLAQAPSAIAIRSPLGWKFWPLARLAVERQIATALPLSTQAILARGPVACRFALDLKARGRISSAAYDARGAVSAEWSEYNVAPSAVWKHRIKNLERNAVLTSDMRLAVSKQLVREWRGTFGYASDRHVVIPCTLSTHHLRPLPRPEEIARRRSEFGLSADEIVICYSGSAAEWQSISKLDQWLTSVIRRNPSASLLILTQADLSETQIVKQYAERVHQMWVPADKVRRVIEVADFGLLMREPSVTNRVAAPTKFAEYLAAGLKMLISSAIGDYSEMVREHGLGIVCDLSDEPPLLSHVSPAERARLSGFAARRFTKASYFDQYAALLKRLGVLASKNTKSLPI